MSLWQLHPVAWVAEGLTRRHTNTHTHTYNTHTHTHAHTHTRTHESRMHTHTSLPFYDVAERTGFGGEGTAVNAKSVLASASH